MKHAHSSVNAAPKKPVNLSVEADLVEKGRALNFNLSEMLSESLRIAIKRRQAEEWLQENKEAIEEHNKRIKKYGMFGDSRRRF